VTAGRGDVTIARVDRPAFGPLGSPGEVVVVIDVIRAVTTAVVLLARGAPHVVCVPDATPAGDTSGHLIVGEQEAPPFPEVDLLNSPTAALAADVRGRPVTLFTANGTPALVRVPPGATILAAAAVNAKATAEWIAVNRSDAPVRLVVTDPRGPEDLACAEYLRALLIRGDADEIRVGAAVTAAVESHAQRWGALVSRAQWAQFIADVKICAQVNSMAMVVIGQHDGPDRVVLRRA
jgi:2-phosphosulfolactate phosphatase